MTTFEVKADSLQFHSVRLHGAVDGLRARQRFEAAMADIDSSVPGLPVRTLLIIRRIAPTARLRLDPVGRTGAFAQSVQAELARNAQQARRPWLHGDTAEAEAVLFADECELMACLLRDWLRGTLASSWWWPVVSDGLSAPEWWRRNLLPRGDLLPAVLSLLAEQGESVTWVTRLSEIEVTQSVTAIIAAHAMNTLPEWLKPAPLLRGEEHHLANAAPVSPQDEQTKTLIQAPSRGSRQDSIAALRHLAALIPESQANALTIPQRRLLALALGLQRASGWTRSPAFVVALQAMEAGNAEVDEDYAPNASTTPNDNYRQDEQTVSPDKALPLPSSRLAANHPAAMDTVATEATDSLASHLMRDRPDRFYKPVRSNSGLFVPLTVAGREFIDASSPHSMILTDKPMASVRPVEQLSGAQSGDLSQHISTFIDQAAQDTIPSGVSIKADLDAAATLSALPPDSEAFSTSEPAALFQQGIETRFGGIFYLLNVALALELYGDFTQPRAQGISLSPWDWLALLGRAWFGRDFEQDAVWHLLAELAGRSSQEEPGHDFLPPDSWSVPDEWLKPWDNAFDLSSAKVYATRKCLQIWHEAGFILIDVGRNLTMAPLAQASELCTQSEVLGAVQLVRIYKPPQKLVQPITLKIADEHSKIPFALSPSAALRRTLSKDERGVGRHLMGESAVNRSCFDRLSTNGSRHISTDFFRITRSDALKRWIHCMLIYLHARLRRALGDDAPEALASMVCCHAARIDCTATTLDVHLALAALPIEIRIAGLDRDPGWIPAAGRSLAFHFE